MTDLTPERLAALNAQHTTRLYDAGEVSHHWLCDVCGVIPDDSDTCTVRTLIYALDRLTRWKAEALTVFAGWEATWEAAGRPGELGTSKAAAVLAALTEARAEVERLTAIVHAKESWIDGAKVDLDAFDEQTLTLTASVAAHASALEREKAKVAFLSREIHDWSHRADALAERIRKVEALPILTVECGDGALRDYVSARDFRAALATTEAGEGS